MTVNFTTDDRKLSLDLKSLVIAGWTGRDAQAVQHHVDELAALGIAPPSQVPLYYRVSRNLLSQSEHVQVLGQSTSGEVEPLLLSADGELWLGLASDHTDRDLEAHSVAASKQACVKPCANELWRFSEVRDHLDALVLECEIIEDGEWVQYQYGTLDAIRPLDELLQGAGLETDSAMLCGTLGAIDGVRAATHYRMSMQDPITQRRLSLRYQVSTLPIIA